MVDNDRQRIVPVERKKFLIIVGARTLLAKGHYMSMATRCVLTWLWLDQDLSESREGANKGMETIG